MSTTGAPVDTMNKTPSADLDLSEKRTTSLTDLEEFSEGERADEIEAAAYDKALMRKVSLSPRRVDRCGGDAGERGKEEADSELELMVSMLAGNRLTCASSRSCRCYSEYLAWVIPAGHHTDDVLPPACSPSSIG